MIKGIKQAVIIDVIHWNTPKINNYKWNDIKGIKIIGKCTFGFYS